MATKNFDKMSDKSLLVLLNSKKTTEDEKSEIQGILEARAEKKGLPEKDPTTPTVVDIESDQETELTPEELEAEKAEIEAREKLVADMKEKIGNKARVVPFNTVQWHDGVVVAVLDDRRAKNPLWVVKDKDGKIIRKAYGSELIEVSDEKSDITFTRKAGGGRGATKKTDYTQEQILQMMAEATAKVGFVVNFTSGKGIETSGIIWAAMHEKRSNKVMLRIKLADGSFAHKVWGTEGYTITESFDEEVVKGNTDKVAKAEKLAADPNARVLFAEDELAAYNKQLVILQEKIKAKEAEIASYKSEPIEVEVETEDETSDELE